MSVSPPWIDPDYPFWLTLQSGVPTACGLLTSFLGVYASLLRDFTDTSRCRLLFFTIMRAYLPLPSLFYSRFFLVSWGYLVLRFSVLYLSHISTLFYLSLAPPYSAVRVSLRVLPASRLTPSALPRATSGIIRGRV